MIATGFIISCIVLFFHFTSWDKQIFSKIKKLVPPENPISKPLYGCPVCMTPWWGSAIYWIFFHEGIRDYLLSLGVAAGLAVIYAILITMKNYLDEIKEK